VIDAAHVALAAARHRLIDRLEALGRALDQGEDRWADYRETAAALAVVDAHLAPDRRERHLTSKELGERFGLSAKVAARKGRNGELPDVEELRFAKRGRAAIRWKA
jgi:hypothetical protein